MKLIGAIFVYGFFACLAGIGGFILWVVVGGMMILLGGGG